LTCTSLLAALGAAALAQSPKPATHIDSAKVNAAYAKHAVIFDHGSYRGMAIGREKDGQSEIHDGHTDIVYFVDGTATLVTGGEIAGAKNTAPGEVRGTGITGGERRTVKKGDVFAVADGTPHFYTGIKTPVKYYLVKVATKDKGKPVSIANFSKGGSLGTGSGYKIGASHRDKDGIAEIHARDTDIFYFIQGTATVITGGTVPDVKPSAAEEARGAAIVSGVRQAVKPGDVMVVPNGLPHQFVDVKGPFDYLTVKVRSAE
jgi:mannose-6-phosphate isomerase-like protein (cupin superfamily)